MSWGMPSGSGGAGLDPDKFVPVTRTINKKPLNKDIVISAEDIEFNVGDNANLDELLKALQLKINELELAINSGTKPSDLKPITDKLDKLKKEFDELSKKTVSDIAKLQPYIQTFDGRYKNIISPSGKGVVITATCQSQRDNDINSVRLGKSLAITLVLTGSNYVKRFGVFYMQQTPRYSEYVVTVNTRVNDTQIAIQEDVYHTDSDGKPTTVAHTSDACHFTDIVISATQGNVDVKTKKNK